SWGTAPRSARWRLLPTAAQIGVATQCADEVIATTWSLLRPDVCVRRVAVGRARNVAQSIEPLPHGFGIRWKLCGHAPCKGSPWLPVRGGNYRQQGTTPRHQLEHFGAATFAFRVQNAEAIDNHQTRTAVQGAAQDLAGLDEGRGVEAAGLRLFAEILADGVKRAMFDVAKSASRAVAAIDLRSGRKSAHNPARRSQAMNEF